MRCRLTDTRFSMVLKNFQQSPNRRQSAGNVRSPHQHPNQGNLFFKLPPKAKGMMKRTIRVISRQCDTSDTVSSGMRKHRGHRTRCKNKNNLEWVLGPVSEIKLKRTDTTLDLSQMAKRGWREKEKKFDEGSQAFMFAQAGQILASCWLSHQGNNHRCFGQAEVGTWRNRSSLALPAGCASLIRIDTTSILSPAFRLCQWLQSSTHFLSCEKLPPA